MLNNFCFDVFAQKWVFVIMSHVTCCMSHVACHMSHVLCQMLMLILGTCWTIFVFMSMLKCRCLWVKMTMLFFDLLLHTLTRDWTNHRAGSQLKSIDILTYKHWLLSIDMKTKVIQHVESEWMRDWKRVLQDIPVSQLFRHSDIFIITRTVKPMLMLKYTQNEAVFQNKRTKRPTMHNSCWKT